VHLLGRPVKTILEGDMTLAAEWLPFARKKATECIRLGIPRKHYEPSNVTIQVRQDLHIVFIRITAGGCPKFHSGLVDIIPPPKPSFGLPDPVWDLKDANGKPYQAIKQIYPRMDTKGATTHGPWVEDKLIAKNYIKDPGSGVNSFLLKTPGKYTGLMRAVVQVMIGQGQFVPYAYHFGSCHGIYMDLMAVPWVIWISQANGVVAWKLPICAQFKRPKLAGATQDLFDRLGFWPIYKDLFGSDTITEAVAKKKARRLASSDDIAEFYTGRSGFFDSCGWAFNYTGSAAQNTCFDMPGGRYIQSYRYQISITGDKTGPLAASLSLIDSGTVYGDRTKTLKVPRDSVGDVISFDWYTHVIPSPEATYDGPLVVFYDTGNIPVVCRCKKVSPAVFGSGPPLPKPTPDSSAASTWQNAYSQVIGGPQIDGKTSLPTDLSNGTLLYQSDPITNIYTGGSFVLSNPDSGVFSDGASAYAVINVGGAGSTIINSISVVVPYGERETFLYYDSNVVYLNSWQYGNSETLVFVRHGTEFHAGRGAILACAPSPRPDYGVYKSPASPYPNWTEISGGGYFWDFPPQEGVPLCGAKSITVENLPPGPVSPVQPAPMEARVASLQCFSSRFSGMVFKDDASKTGQIALFWDGVNSHTLWAACDALSPNTIVTCVPDSTAAANLFNNSVYDSSNLHGFDDFFAGVP
jgi:hypothetical protein